MLAGGHSLDRRPYLILGDGLVETLEIKVIGVQAVKRDRENKLLRGSENDGEVVEGGFSKGSVLGNPAVANL